MQRKTVHLAVTTFLVISMFFTAVAQENSVPDQRWGKGAIGLKFGGMVSDLWYPGTDASFDYDHQCPVGVMMARESYQIGFSYYRNLSEAMIFNAEIIYQRKGRISSSCLWPVVVPTWTSPFDFLLLDYLTGSSSILFSTKGKITAYAGPGIYHSLLVNSASWLTISGDWGRYYSGPAARRYDAGFCLTSGIRFPLHQSIHANLQVSGSTSAIPIFSKRQRNRFDYDGIYMNTIALNKTLGGTLTISYRL